MLIEFHDDEIGKGDGVTLCGIAGRKGTIEFPYQAEMHIQDMLDDGGPIKRVYIYSQGFMWAIVARENNQTYYLAKRPEWPNELQLPFLTKATKVVSMTMKPEIEKLDRAPMVVAPLQNPEIASVVFMDEDGVVEAWERDPNGNPILVSKSPRPLPQRRA